MTDKSVSFADDIATHTYKRSAPNPVDELLKEESLKKRDVDSDSEEKDVEGEDVPVKKTKHTLDSDEEDEDDHKRLDMKKVDGQEDDTVDFDGNTKITPFNMKDCEDDGHFDNDGNFIFEKKDELKDSWLDNIDWGSIKKKAGKQWEVSNEKDDSAPVADMSDVRRKEIFTRLIELLKPGQNVATALTAMKKAKAITPAEERKLRWAAKKAGKNYVDESAKLSSELSGLADELISAGHMDAYEWTRERVDVLMGNLAVATDSLDMFGDEEPAQGSSAGGSGGGIGDEVVKWHYKESEDACVEGPFTSEEMARRQEEGKLGPKSVVRKLGTDSFNPAARVDFDLYC